MNSTDKDDIPTLTDLFNDQIRAQKGITNAGAGITVVKKWLEQKKQDVLESENHVVRTTEGIFKELIEDASL